MSGALRAKLRTERVLARVFDALSYLDRGGRCRQMDLVQCKRIGVLLPWGIGDAVLAVPLLKALGEVNPHIGVDILGKKWLGELFPDESWYRESKELVVPWTKYQRKYRVWTKEWWIFWKQIRRIRNEQYDLIVSLRYDVRDNVLLRMLGANYTAGFGGAGGRYWLSHVYDIARIEYDSCHRSEVAARCALSLTGVQVDPNPSLSVSEELKRTANLWLQINGYAGGKVLAVHMGAGHKVRRLDPQVCASVINGVVDQVGFVVVIDDGDRDAIKELGSAVNRLGGIWKGSLRELKGLLSVCPVLLCGDSGVMHIAAACGANVTAIFGPMYPHWFGPRGGGHQVVYREPMSCRPCFDKCIYAVPKCISNIETDRIIDSVGTLLR